MKRIDYYKLYNRLQLPYTLIPYHLGQGRAFRPLRYNIHLTYRCNLACPFCNARSLTHEELDTQTWLNFVDAVPRFSVLSFSGGEVTLRRDFKTILKRSLQRAKVSFLTNGTRFDDELIDLIVAEKLFMLGVSLDGLGERHDRIRGGRGAFDKAVKGLRALQERKRGSRYPRVDIKTVILDDNMDQLSGLYELADSLQADTFTISFLKGCRLQFCPILEEEFSPDFFRTKYTVGQYFDMGAFKEAYRELLAFSKGSATQLRLYPEFFPSRGDQELRRIERFFEEEDEKNARETYCRCLYPWTQISIVPNGDCFPCLSYRIGNIKDGPISQVWNHQRFIEFRKKLRDAGIFSSCQGCCHAIVK